MFAEKSFRWWETRDAYLESSRLVRGVSQPPAVRRDPASEFAKRRPKKRDRRALTRVNGSNDAARLAADPRFRLIGSPKIWDRGAALTSTLHWFETELLTRGENLVELMAVNRDVLAQVESPKRADRVVLDMGSSESPVRKDPQPHLNRASLTDQRHVHWAPTNK